MQFLNTQINLSQFQQYNLGVGGTLNKAIEQGGAESFSVDGKSYSVTNPGDIDKLVNDVAGKLAKEGLTDSVNIRITTKTGQQFILHLEETKDGLKGAVTPARGNEKPDKTVEEDLIDQVDQIANKTGFNEMTLAIRRQPITDSASLKNVELFRKLIFENREKGDPSIALMGSDARGALDQLVEQLESGEKPQLYRSQKDMLISLAIEKIHELKSSNAPEAQSQIDNLIMLTDWISKLENY